MTNLTKLTKTTIKLGSHSINTEWQVSKCSDYVYKNVRIGRKKYGELRKYKSGRVVYWAIRQGSEIVYKENAWAIDMSTFSMLRCLGSPDIGILVDNGDKWIISFENFDKHKIKWDYSDHVGKSIGAKGKLGALQWIVKLNYFLYKKGKPEDMEEAMKIRKWK